MNESVRFARVGAARVGYQIHGSGDLDVVYSPGLASHLDMTLEQPRYRRYIEQLAGLGRVIRFDRRGSGVSDPVPPGAEESWEMWADDLSAVLDDAQCRAWSVGPRWPGNGPSLWRRHVAGRRESCWLPTRTARP